MRFCSLVLLAFAGLAAAQTPIPPTETAPTGSVTVSGSGTRTGTRTGTNSATGTASSGTITASTNATETLATTSAAPTTTSYPYLGDASPCVVNCMQSSVSQANCSTITQVDCYCTSQRFRDSLVQCVAATCPNDLSNAENLGQAISLTYPPAPTSTTPASTSNPSNTATSAPNTNNAVGKRQGGMWALAALALGAAL